MAVAMQRPSAVAGAKQKEVPGGEHVLQQQLHPPLVISGHQCLAGKHLLELGIVVVGKTSLAGFFNRHSQLGRLAERVAARLAAEIVENRVFIRALRSTMLPWWVV